VGIADESASAITIDDSLQWINDDMSIALASWIDLAKTCLTGSLNAAHCAMR
jgi:hypothetical protein